MLSAVKSEDLLLPIVVLSAVACAVGTVGCEKPLLCDCIATNHTVRGPIVTTFVLLSLLVESVFSSSLLSWLSSPLFVATFMTANNSLPDWVWASTLGLHFWVASLTAAVELAVAVYRCWMYERRLSLALVVTMAAGYLVVQIVRWFAESSDVLDVAQGAFSIVSLITARVVAAACVKETRRGEQGSESVKAVNGSGGLPVLPLKR